MCPSRRRQLERAHTRLGLAAGVSEGSLGFEMWECRKRVTMRVCSESGRPAWHLHM